MGHSGGVGSEPGGAGEFEAFLEDVFVAALDEAGADGQAAGEGGRVGELVTAVGEIAVGGAERGGGRGRGGGFAARGQRGDDGRGPALAEGRLLPGKVVGLAGPSGGGEIAADVTEVQEVAAGHAEAGAGEAGDPFGAVAEGMDVGGGGPAGLAGGVLPLPADFAQIAETDRVVRVSLPGGLRGQQPDFAVGDPAEFAGITGAGANSTCGSGVPPA